MIGVGYGLEDFEKVESCIADLLGGEIETLRFVGQAVILTTFTSWTREAVRNLCRAYVANLLQLQSVNMPSEIVY